MRKLVLFAFIFGLFSLPDCKSFISNFESISGSYRFAPFLPIAFFSPDDTLLLNPFILDTLVVRLIRNPDCNVKLRGYIAPFERKNDPKVEEELAKKRAGIIATRLMKSSGELQGRVFVDGWAYDFRYSPFLPESLNSRVELELEFPNVKPRTIYTTEKGKRWAHYADAVVADFGLSSRAILKKNPDLFAVIIIKDISFGLSDRDALWQLIYELEKKLKRAIGKEFSHRVLSWISPLAVEKSETRAELLISGFNILWLPLSSYSPGDSIFAEGDNWVYSLDPCNDKFMIKTDTGLPIGYVAKDKFNIYSFVSPFFNPYMGFVLDCGVVSYGFRLKTKRVDLRLCIPLAFYISDAESLVYPELEPVFSLISSVMKDYPSKLDSMNISLELYISRQYGMKLAQSRLDFASRRLLDSFEYALFKEGIEAEKWFQKNRVSFSKRYEFDDGVGIFSNVLYLWIELFKGKK